MISQGQNISPDMIDAAYRASGNTMGWRLFCSPAATIEDAEIGFIGLNPVGREWPQGQSQFAMRNGSGYVVESWADCSAGQSKLQQQVRKLFSRLRVAPELVLAGNLMPVRSADWCSLRNSKGSLAFGRQVWSKLLTLAKPKLVIGMRRLVIKNLIKNLGAGPAEHANLGWGKVKSARAECANGTLGDLPHLSRFSVVGRTTSEQGLSELFRPDWQK